MKGDNIMDIDVDTTFLLKFKMRIEFLIAIILAWEIAKSLL